jgi:fluoride exporter
MTPVLVLMVGIGGAVGAYARYSCAGWIYARVGTGFPWGTLTVNIIGSFLLGSMLPLLEAHDASPAIHAFVTVGCIGAFTTFSTFAYESVTLLRDLQRGRAAAYMIASVGLGLLAIVVGLLTSRTLL